jgi:small subunit ribosomal protein S20
VPNKKFARKRLRQSEKRRLRNRASKSAMRSAIKDVLGCMEQGEVAQLEPRLQRAVSIIGKNAKMGIIHKRTASRYEARLMKRVQKFMGAKAPPQEKPA